MRDPIDHFGYAQTVADGTPLAEAAQAICFAREVGSPYVFVATPYGPLLRWQAIIMEARLMSMIAQYDW